MKKIIIFPSLCLLLMACSHERSVEEQAADMLSQAREHLSLGEAQAAKDTILSLRQRFPSAIEIRREAILTLDSAELILAQGDTLKTEFYLRKIEFDKNRK